jgi:hypothetical protein
MYVYKQNPIFNSQTYLEVIDIVYLDIWLIG